MSKASDFTKYDNSYFYPGAGILKRTLWYFVNAAFVNSSFPFSGLKVILLKLFGASIGKGAVIKPYVNIKYPWNLSLGNHVWLGEMVWIDNLSKVTIGNNVCISQGAMLLCGNHNYTKSSFDLIVKEIVIEDGVWIGAKCTVCPGVVCYSHSVLTVNSVATKNTDAYAVYSGNPALKIKDRVLQ